MKTKDAVVKRFIGLCLDKDIAFNSLATLSGVTPSTVYSLLNKNRRDVSIITIKKLCDGLEITLSEFFNDELFHDLEQEIS